MSDPKPRRQRIKKSDSSESKKKTPAQKAKDKEQKLLARRIAKYTVEYEYKLQGKEIPKKTNGYALFVQEKTLDGLYNNMPAKDRIRQLAADWKTLSVSEQASWKLKAIQHNKSI